VAEVGVDDDAEPFELLQVPVDGGQMHVGRVGLHFDRQLLGRTVLTVVEERLEEQSS
jgi:hypothetical protein